MKHARKPWRPLLSGGSVLALGSVWAVACAGPQAPGAAGSVCFRTDDCKDGLACVPTAKGSSKSICSADLTLVVSMVDGAPPDSATPISDAASGSGPAAPAGGSGGSPPVAGGAAGKAATAGATGLAGSGPAAAGGGGGTGAGGKASGGAQGGSSGTAASGGGAGGSQPIDAGDG